MVKQKRKAATRKKPSKSPFPVLQYTMLGREVSVGVDPALWVSFTVEVDGKTFGNKVRAKSALPVDVAAAAFLLACNAVDSINSFASETE